MVQSKDFKNCVNIAGSNFWPLPGTDTQILNYYHAVVLGSAYSELKITFLRKQIVLLIFIKSLVIHITHHLCDKP